MKQVCGSTPLRGAAAGERGTLAYRRVQGHGHHVLRRHIPVVPALGRERGHISRRGVLARAALDLRAGVGRAAPAGMQHSDAVVAVHVHHPPEAGREQAAHVIIGNNLGVLADAKLCGALLDLGCRGDRVGCVIGRKPRGDAGTQIGSAQPAARATAGGLLAPHARRPLRVVASVSVQLSVAAGGWGAVDLRSAPADVAHSRFA